MFATKLGILLASFAPVISAFCEAGASEGCSALITNDILPSHPDDEPDAPDPLNLLQTKMTVVRGSTATVEEMAHSESPEKELEHAEEKDKHAQNSKLLTTNTEQVLRLHKTWNPSGECASGLAAMKVKLREAGFMIPKDGNHTVEVEGGSAYDEVALLAQVVSKELDNKVNPTICQTGFNYGSSAFAFLCSTSATVVSFDLGAHPYVNRSAELIAGSYPGRHKLIIGDSTKTIPSAIPSMTSQCDVVFVDGGHSHQVALSDLQNFKAMARPNTLVLVDDCTTDASAGIQAVSEAYNEAVAKKVLRNEQDPNAKLQSGRALCLGRYSP